MTIDPLVLANIRHLFFQENLNMKQIQALTNVSYTRIRQEIKGTPYQKKKYDSSSRHIISKQNLENIKQFVKLNPNKKWYLKDLKREVKTLPDCSKSTLSRALKRANIKTFKTIKKFKINNQIKQERINYCNYYLELKNQHPDLFNSHVYTDESIFYNRSFASFTRSVNRKRENLDNYLQINTNKYKANFYGVLSKYSFTLVRIIGKFNQTKYHQIMIKNRMLDYIKSIVPGTTYLVQDNCSSHEFGDSNPRTIMEECNERNINLVYFPRYSPDLNIIENVWGHLKQKLSQSMINNPIESSNQLFERVESIANREITTEFIKKLYDSIPYRLKKVLELNGEMVNY